MKIKSIRLMSEDEDLIEVGQPLPSYFDDEQICSRIKIKDDEFCIFAHKEISEDLEIFKGHVLRHFVSVINYHE